MKILGYNIKAKTVVFILFILAEMSILQTYILYMFKKHGNLDFYNLEHHIFAYLGYIISTFCSFYAWFLVDRRYHQNNTLKTVIAFMLSCLIFMVFGAILDYGSRMVAGGTKSFVDILINTGAIMVLFHIYLAGFVFAFIHVYNAQKAILAVERAQKEKEALQSQILQKNLEPHFLFNNLSVMSGLARKNPRELESFIDDFSDVYRYYLKHGKDKVVSLQEELGFLDSYMGVMRKRFGDAYRLNIQLADTEGYMIPSSVHLCVENAIKHNKANEANPLEIEIYREQDCIVIKNKINRVDFTLGTGTGNDYLKRQYALQFEREVHFEEVDKHYYAYIPIIENTII